MSTSYNRRKKLIKKLQKKYGPKKGWTTYREIVDELDRQRNPFMGTLADIISQHT